MTEVTYRRATLADVPLVDRLLRDLATYEGGTIRGDQASLTRYGFGDRPQFRVVLAERDGVALGFVLCLPEYSSWRGRMGIVIQDLFVSEAARGSGLGRGLLAAALREAADWEPQFLTLMVYHTNAKARAFYEAMGFTLREKADLLVCEGEALARLAG